ncbi:Gfo/Idh/MocA family protein [Actinopolymorpha alba]|uniref:Gfo/Idh/MocA family protein n=1 Tax=Actinopolymorpha alba TaxID=533267 RepID=UPI00037FD1B9|nr:Gfo/Idh/MocA family oxidoreductase [Actinopolymorpha alba]
MRRIHLVLVGLGDIGLKAHLPALLRSDEVEVVGLVDPSPERRADAVAMTHGRVPAYADVGEVRGLAGVDGVVLATPPWVTPALARRFLRAGLAVLAEKPLATSLQESRPLAELPADLRRRLQVGLTYRHDPALARLRTWIRDGPLDGPLLVRAHIYDERLDPADPTHAARLRTTLEHGPPVVHEGAHVFDWLAFVLDAAPARVVDAWAVCTDPGAGLPNLNGARLVYDGGTTALVEFGWLTHELPRCELSFLGQRGYAVLDGFTFRLHLRSSAGEEVVDDPVDRTTRCFDRQLAAFADLVAGRVDTAVPGIAEGLASLELSERVAQLARRSEGD